jgi:hypothetical protein
LPRTKTTVVLRRSENNEKEEKEGMEEMRACGFNGANEMDTFKGKQEGFAACMLQVFDATDTRIQYMLSSWDAAV